MVFRRGFARAWALVAVAGLVGAGTDLWPGRADGVAADTRPTAGEHGWRRLDQEAAQAPVFVPTRALAREADLVPDQDLDGTPPLYLPLANRWWPPDTGLAPALEAAGQIGGRVGAVAVAGDTAYVGIGPRLVLLDLADAAHPVQVGQSAMLPDLVVDLVVDGTFAYVALGKSGIATVEVGDPSRPRIASLHATPGVAAGIDVADGFAYVVHGPYPDLYFDADVSFPADVPFGVLVFSVDHAGHLGYAGEIAAPDSAGQRDLSGDLDVVGQTAYIGYGHRQRPATATGTLWIVDTTDPRAPRTKATLGLDGAAVDVAVVGTRAFVAAGLALQVFSVSDPAAPRRVGSAPGVGAWPAHLSVGDGLAAVLTEQWGVRLFDISVPDAPRLVWADHEEAFPVGAAFLGDHLVVAESEAIRILSLTEPAAPRDVAVVEPLTAIGGVRVVGDVAWLAGTKVGLAAVDISDPRAPAEISRLAIDGPARDVAIDDDLAVVTTWRYESTMPLGCPVGSLHVIDVSDARAPVRLGSVTLPCGAMRVDLHEGYAFVAAEEAGLVVVDVASPTEPRIVATRPITWGARDVVVSRGRAFVASGVLQELDVGDPSNPRYLDRQPTASGDVVRVRVDYLTAFTAAEATGIVLWDVSEPSARRRLAVVDAERPTAVDASGGMAAAGVNGGLLAIDVRDPTRPRPAGLLGWAVWEGRGRPSIQDVVVRDGLVFVSGGAAGLVLVPLD